eukprot:GFUD01004363.1.p1 GENE.GFUD01004363.1~~GFUD01004363.1.p1  ORF type:complete len:319 (+),score=48.72 GFUD01004363.1:60-1016(+)
MGNKKFFFALLFLFAICFVMWTLINLAGKTLRNTNVSELQSFPIIEPYKCKETNELYGGIKTQICLKPLEVDRWISRKIDDWGSWEGSKVSVVLKAMSVYPTAVFLDIGCNIGMYTVMVAAAGRRVVAVDAMLVNLAYVHHSLMVGNTTQYVRLLHNAVSEKRETLFPVLGDLSNQGATRMVPEQIFKEKNMKAAGPPVNSTTLLDILNFINTDIVVIKMDVEGFECKVLHTYLINDHPPFYLPYINMEWMHIRTNKDSNCPDLLDMVDALYSASYQPYELPAGQSVPNTLKPIDRANIENIQRDILWAHKDAPALFW